MSERLLNTSLKTWFIVMALTSKVSYRTLELECGIYFEIILFNFLDLCREI
jgi:hypothetical protein